MIRIPATRRNRWELAQGIAMIIAGLLVAAFAAFAQAAEIEIRGATSIRLGDYTLKLDGRTNVWIDATTGTIRIGNPATPGPEPTPAPGIESLEPVAKAAFDRITGVEPGKLTQGQRGRVAAVFRDMKVSSTGEAANENELGALTTERIRATLGDDAGKARPAIEAIFRAANRLRDAGKIVTIGDWAKAWKAIAKGVWP